MKADAERDDVSLYTQLEIPQIQQNGWFTIHNGVALQLIRL
jgi:hypothetical protein